MTHPETTPITPAATPADDLAQRTIRDLVEEFPATMSVLAPLGIDLCCGGAHPVGEAITLHGADPAVVLPRVAEVIAATQRAR
jgi:iron-sulfur cluster repair protein YtfE (RIC family)